MRWKDGPSRELGEHAWWIQTSLKSASKQSQRFQQLMEWSEPLRQLLSLDRLTLALANTAVRARLSLDMSTGSVARSFTHAVRTASDWAAPVASSSRLLPPARAMPTRAFTGGQRAVGHACACCRGQRRTYSSYPTERPGAHSRFPLLVRLADLTCGRVPAHQAQAPSHRAGSARSWTSTTSRRRRSPSPC